MASVGPPDGLAYILSVKYSRVARHSVPNIFHRQFRTAQSTSKKETPISKPHHLCRANFGYLRAIGERRIARNHGKLSVLACANNAYGHYFFPPF
jgi:hypothetical protein